MTGLVILFLCKLITLAGSTATTAWLVSFFVFTETLGPYRWELLLGGTTAVALGEGASYLVARRMARI